MEGTMWTKIGHPTAKHPIFGIMTMYPLWQGGIERRFVTSLLQRSYREWTIRVHGDGLVVGEGIYRHRDLDILPFDLSLGKAKTREEEQDIFFQGEYSPLSNFFPSYIEADDSIEFYSAEQAFQFRKACFMGDDLTAAKILKTRDTYEVRGSRIRSNPNIPILKRGALCTLT